MPKGAAWLSKPTMPDERPVPLRLVPHAEVAAPHDAHFGVPSAIRVAALGLGMLFVLLTAVLSAAFWSQAGHGEGGAFLGWAPVMAAGHDRLPPVNALVPSQPATPLVGAKSARTVLISDLDYESDFPPAAPLPTEVPHAALHVSMAESALDLKRLAVSASPTSRPTSTPIPPSPTPTPTPGPPVADSPPTRLAIPALGLDARVRPVGYTSVEKKGEPVARWDTLPSAASFHNTSALPGHPGNTVINGHRDIHGAVFYSLDRVKVGDEIVLFVDSLAYRYEVTETRAIRYVRASAEELAEHRYLIGSLPEQRLTLVTCTPVGLASHRLYVIAKPVSGADSS